MTTTGFAVSENGARSPLAEMIEVGESGLRSSQYVGQNSTCVGPGCDYPCIWNCTDGKCIDCYTRNRAGDMSPAVRVKRSVAKLNADIVRTIRREHAADPNIPFAHWAKKYEVSRSTIISVVRREFWKHVTEEA